MTSVDYYDPRKHELRQGYRDLAERLGNRRVNGKRAVVVAQWFIDLPFNDKRAIIQSSRNMPTKEEGDTVESIVLRFLESIHKAARWPELDVMIQARLEHDPDLLASYNAAAIAKYA